MTTINKQISLGTDDAEEEDDSTLDLVGDLIRIGNGGVNSRDGCFRWQTVNIPKAANITTAKLSLYLKYDSGTLSANIRGIDEDNTVTWAGDNRPSQRTKTTATITANEANWNNWATDSWIDIDITNVIQEIVDRGGWSANNALAVVIEDTSTGGVNQATVYTYEYTGNAHGAKLDVVYEVRTAKPTRSTMNVHPGVMFQTLTGGHGY